MTANLSAGNVFPDFELPDHRKKPRRLSGFTEPSPMDEKLGFTDGYPLILIFGRGFFCPRDQQHMRQLVRFQAELAVNYCKLVTVSAASGWDGLPGQEPSGPSCRTKSGRSLGASGEQLDDHPGGIQATRAKVSIRRGGDG